MNEWFRPVCQTLAPEDAAVLSIISMALVLVVLAVIALGFGPLRAWFGLTGGPTGDEGGLRNIWRLYRETGRSHPNVAFSLPSLSSLAVSNDRGERAQDEPHLRNLGVNAARSEGSNDHDRPIGMIEPVDTI